MKSNKKRLARIALVTSFATLVVFAIALIRIERPRPITEIESTIATLPIGITADEADRIMGSPPDSVDSTRGVLVTPVTMLAATNEHANNYGEPQEYSMRMWKRDGVQAVVAVDSNGAVAGHWAWRPN